MFKVEWMQKPEVVVHSRVELLFREWKSLVLTDRRMDHSRFAGAKVRQKTFTTKHFYKKSWKSCYFCSYIYLLTSFFRTFAVKMTELQQHAFGIVLHALRYGDNSVIVEIYTQALGSVSFLVRQSQGGKNRLRASLWQPLTLVEVVWVQHPQANLQKPRELTIWKPWHDIPFQPVKATMALFLGEFLWRTLDNLTIYNFTICRYRVIVLTC